MTWLEMALSGANNSLMTGIESSFAIEELDESLIEKIENVKNPKVKQFYANSQKEWNNWNWTAQKQK